MTSENKTIAGTTIPQDEFLINLQIAMLSVVRLMAGNYSMQLLTTAYPKTLPSVSGVKYEKMCCTLLVEPETGQAVGENGTIVTLELGVNINGGKY